MWDDSDISAYITDIYKTLNNLSRMSQIKQR